MKEEQKRKEQLAKEEEAENQNRIKLRLFFIIPLFVIGLIVFFNVRSCNNKKIHSPESLEIEAVSLSTEYKSYGPPYYNGRYYVYIGFEVKADDIGLKFIGMNVNVSNKSGKKLGVLYVTLNMDVKEGESDVIKTEWAEQNPSRNDFFSDLYEARIDDLVFEYEIQEIRFDDGKQYLLPSY